MSKMLKFLISIVLVICLSGCGKQNTVENQMFIEFNWADEDILMSHELKPLDSGAGWEFFVSDIDFDGNPEMLVSFASNGGGNNSPAFFRITV